MVEGSDDAIVASVRATIRAGNSRKLIVDDLTVDDLGRIAWSGNPAHIRHVQKALERVAGGEVGYLAVRAPDGSLVSKGGIDYRAHPGMGTIWQLATHPALQSLGLGTRLILEAERRIVHRGSQWAVLAVEDTNPRARALYERLGYRYWRRQTESWQVEEPNGGTHLYETDVSVLRKRLT